MLIQDDLYVGGLLDLEVLFYETSKNKVPAKVPGDSCRKPLQKLLHRSSWMILHNFEPKKSKNGSVFVSVALFKVA